MADETQLLDDEALPSARGTTAPQHLASLRQALRSRNLLYPTLKAFSGPLFGEDSVRKSTTGGGITRGNGGIHAQPASPAPPRSGPVARPPAPAARQPGPFSSSSSSSSLEEDEDDVRHLTHISATPVAETDEVVIPRQAQAHPLPPPGVAEDATMSPALLPQHESSSHAAIPPTLDVANSHNRSAQTLDCPNTLLVTDFSPQDHQRHAVAVAAAGSSGQEARTEAKVGVLGGDRSGGGGLHALPETVDDGIPLMVWLDDEACGAARPVYRANESAAHSERNGTEGNHAASRGAALENDDEAEDARRPGTLTAAAPRKAHTPPPSLTDDDAPLLPPQRTLDAPSSKSAAGLVEKASGASGLTSKRGPQSRGTVQELAVGDHVEVKAGALWGAAVVTELLGKNVGYRWLTDASVSYYAERKHVRLIRRRGDADEGSASSVHVAGGEPGVTMPLAPASASAAAAVTTTTNGHVPVDGCGSSSSTLVPESALGGAVGAASITTATSNPEGTSTDRRLPLSRSSGAEAKVRRPSTYTDGGGTDESRKTEEAYVIQSAQLVMPVELNSSSDDSPDVQRCAAFARPSTFRSSGAFVRTVSRDDRDDLITPPDSLLFATSEALSELDNPAGLSPFLDVFLRPMVVASLHDVVSWAANARFQQHVRFLMLASSRVIPADCSEAYCASIAAAIGVTPVNVQWLVAAKAAGSAFAVSMESYGLRLARAEHALATQEPEKRAPCAPRLFPVPRELRVCSNDYFWCPHPHAKTELLLEAAGGTIVRGAEDLLRVYAAHAATPNAGVPAAAVGVHPRCFVYTPHRQRMTTTLRDPRLTQVVHVDVPWLLTSIREHFEQILLTQPVSGFTTTATTEVGTSAVKPMCEIHAAAAAAAAAQYESRTDVPTARRLAMEETTNPAPAEVAASAEAGREALARLPPQASSERMKRKRETEDVLLPSDTYLPLRKRLANPDLRIVTVGGDDSRWTLTGADELTSTSAPDGSVVSLGDDFYFRMPSAHYRDADGSAPFAAAEELGIGRVVQLHGNGTVTLRLYQVSSVSHWRHRGTARRWTILCLTAEAMSVDITALEFDTPLFVVNEEQLDHLYIKERSAHPPAAPL